MNQTSKRMLQTLCRLCAAEKPLLIRIFDRGGLERNLPVKIQLTLGITVSEDDVLPLSICYLCLEKLETYNSFVESCQASQVRLNELHSQCNDIANIDVKPNSAEDNVVEVVFIDSNMYETKCTIPTSSLNAMENETTLEDVQSVAVMKANYRDDDDSVVVLNTCDAEWEEILSEDEQCNKAVAQARNVRTKEVANTVYNVFKEDLQVKKEMLTNRLSSNEYEEKESTTYTCPICETKFNRRGNLQQHLKIHTGVKPYQCDECALTFLRRQHLIRHKRVHTGEKPFRCDICGLCFTRKTSVRKHIENHLAPPKQLSLPSSKSHQFTEIPADEVGAKQYVCNLCGASFARRNYVLQHAVVHTTERPYVCDICSYSFARSQHLSRHMMIHMDIRPHKCETCNSAFRRSSYLKQHQKIHLRGTENTNDDIKSENPYDSVQCTCEICGNSFSDIKYLRQHYKTHSTEKPFECHDCGSSFRRKHHLRRHVLIHTGEKPFLCSVCGASFARKFYLKVHSVVHSDEKPYSCKVCGNAFSRNSSLRQHMKTHVFIKTEEISIEKN